jgi:hypothetical protein
VGSVFNDGSRLSDGAIQSSVVTEGAASSPAAGSVPVPAEVVTSSSVSETVPPLGDIPEPPAVPPVVEELIETLPLSGELPFENIGLGGWTPVGIVQNCMEYLHIGCDLPWWATIAIGKTDLLEEGHIFTSLVSCFLIIDVRLNYHHKITWHARNLICFCSQEEVVRAVREGSLCSCTLQ